jgi:hypothetical protein
VGGPGLVSALPESKINRLNSTISVFIHPHNRLINDDTPELNTL